MEEDLLPSEVEPIPFPVVSGLDSDLFEEGEIVTVSGAHGTVSLPQIEEVPVVTAFLQDELGRILLLKRSGRVGSFPGRWAAVSGYLEAATALEQARTEVEEETGLSEDQLQLLAEGDRPVYAREGARVYSVHPFLFRTVQPSVRLDWEHDALRWIDPVELPHFPTVPKLEKVWSLLSPSRAPRRAGNKN